MARTLIGRRREREILNQAMTSDRSELVAVYGRRRIGKTFLIRQHYANDIVFSFTGLGDGNRKEQIKNFMLKLSDFTNAYVEHEPPVDWLEAFTLLKRYMQTIDETEKKKVIFIDEFPWLDTQRSGFLPAFENFWNDYCTTRSDLIVVICGSAASYMVKKILHNKKGLSKRVTKSIKLLPFTLGEVKDFFAHKNYPMDEMELLKIYMAFGGVAEYLENIERGESATTAIDRMCFGSNAYMESEFEEVFKSLYEDNSFHHKIMLVLSNNKKKGLTREEILSQMQIKSGGRFSEALNDLIYAGFVLKYDANIDKRKITLYRIYDEFCLFHLQFISKNKNSSWLKLYQKQTYVSWTGYAFESICLKHVEQIKKALRCDQISSVNYAWNNTKAQIDLVIDRDDRIVNLLEIKFYNDEFSLDADDLKRLRNKEKEYRNDTKTKKAIYSVMLSTWGVNENQYSQAILSNNLSMHCLFES
jgi:AAA+ ATPase superfamily predicted ATPase